MASQNADHMSLILRHKLQFMTSFNYFLLILHAHSFAIIQVTINPLAVLLV